MKKESSSKMPMKKGAKKAATKSMMAPKKGMPMKKGA